MPRIGQNPMKWVKGVHQPERITITTIVFIPHLYGYWSESLEVLKLCLQSLHRSTCDPYDLIVFDNGSCSTVQDYLLDQHRRGLIEFLILSEHNVGKAGAWNFLFQSAPGEIIVYMDSDVYFLPGWLEASLEVLDTFPKAGMVTAQPARRSLAECSATLTAAREDPSITSQTGELLPEKYMLAHRCGLGDTPEGYHRRIKDRKDCVLSRNGVDAYVSASHFQFLTTKWALKQVLPLRVTEVLGRSERQILDVSLDEVGLWRLSTSDYLVHHIGNEIPKDLSGADWVFDGGNANVARREAIKDRPRKRRLLRNRFVRHVLKRINVVTYRLLY